MSFAQRIKEALGKQTPRSEPHEDPHDFIRRRQAAARAMSPAELDAMTERALANVDPEQTLREIEALRQRVEARRDNVARSSPD
jgi:hypothetical protein